MTAENLCVVCNRPMADVAYACTGCGRKAVEQLQAIVDTAPAARDVAHGLARRGSGSSTNKPGSRPPMDFGVMERLDEIQNSLVGWVRHVAAERGVSVPARGANPASDVIVDDAKWLVGQVEWLRHRQEAPEALEDFTHGARAIAGIANGPTPGRYAGPCGYVDEDEQLCGEDVEARPGASYATCKACGSRYDVEERQAWMRGEIEGYLARPVEIAGMLLRLGFPVGYSTIAAYVAKGQLVAHGSDEKGRALFRIGDVIDLRMGAKKPRRERELPRGVANPVGG